MGLNVSGGPLEWDAIINDSQFGAAIRRMESDLKRLTQNTTSQTKEIESFASKAAIAVGGFLSLNAATGFISKMVEVRSEFQKIEAVLTNSLGSNDLAKGALGMIADYAAKTPFQLQEIAQAYVKLVNQGFTPTKEELSSLGDLAASTGKGFNQLAEAILDAQQGEGERLKEFGIRMEKNGDLMKFTFKGVSTEVANTSTAIKDYIAGLGQLQGVSGSTAAISATLGGQISNLQDAFSRMLNELGQGSEGVISSAIAGVSTLVENYQTVIDAVKVLVITYGAYKAALIVTTSLTNGYTLAETLRYQAMLISERAMKLLNASMLATPAGAIAAAVGLLASAYFLLKDRVTDAAKAQQAVNDVQLEAAQNIDTEKRSLESLLKIALDETRSKEDRAAAMRKINEISPEYLGNLTIEKIKTGEGKAAIDQYIEALSRKAKAQAANAALEKLYQRQLEVRSNSKGSTGVGLAKDIASSFIFGGGVLADSNELTAIESQIAAIKKSYGGAVEEILLGDKKVTESSKRTVAVIDGLIKAAKDNQQKQSTNAEQYQAFQREINQLEAERKRIVGESKAEIKAAQVEENKLNGILHEREGILQDLAALHRDATQSGLTKEASEIDRINEKYDLTLKKVDEFNKKNQNNKQVPKISTLQINQIGSDRLTEINNARLKQEAEDYKKSLEQQRDVFAQFEDAKKQIGIQRANEMFAVQTKGFDNYLDYLKSERASLAAQVESGGFDVGVSAKIKANAEQIVAAEKEATKVAFDEYANLLNATQTYADKKLQIENQYNKDVQLARSKFTGEDLKGRLASLVQNRNADLINLKDNLARQGKLFQILNADIIRETREQLQERLKLLKQYVKDGYVIEKDGSKTLLTPEMLSAAQQGISSINGLLNETRNIIGLSNKDFKKLVEIIDLTGSSLSQLGAAVAPLNEGLGSALSQMGEMASISGNVVRAFSGDPTAAVAAVTGILKRFGDAKKSRIESEKQVEEFQSRILASEFEISLQYRERARSQQNINDLKIEGLKKEQQLLDKQKKQNEEDYKNILSRLQKESFISGLGTEKEGFNPIFGLVGLFGRKTRVTETLSSLAGKSFEDIEKLFASGQLTENANKLFQQLQKLKQEGADIDQLIENAKEEAKQIFTGTTAESITDTIVKGFADGKRSVADFADDTESLIRGALLNALKYQALEGPLKKLYDQFAIDAESGNGLDLSEIEKFQAGLAAALMNADQMAKQLEQATGVSLSANSTGQGNSLAGAIKGMTAQQADLLAGQFGGLRLTALDTLNVSRSSLITLNKIETNTASTLNLLEKYYRKWDTIGGLKVELK